MSEILVYEDESVEDLQYKGLKLIQKNSGFRFGVDAVLLANFVDIRKNSKVIDLGTGNGIIPILIAGKTTASHITGLEIQESIAEMAGRSIELNGLESKVTIVQGDIKQAAHKFGKSVFDVVVSNPPYMNCGAGLTNSIDTKTISRHEILCTLEDVISSASAILAPGGQFAMVHRPERLVDIMCLMRKYKLEPKYLKFVHPSPHKKPNLILVKGSRGGNPHLKMLPPLYVFDVNGEFSEEINKIYCRGEYNVD